jgi:hypothetical protein
MAVVLRDGCVTKPLEKTLSCHYCECKFKIVENDISVSLYLQPLYLTEIRFLLEYQTHHVYEFTSRKLCVKRCPDCQVINVIEKIPPCAIKRIKAKKAQFVHFNFGVYNNKDYNFYSMELFHFYHFDFRNRKFFGLYNEKKDDTPIIIFLSKDTKKHHADKYEDVDLSLLPDDMNPKGTLKLYGLPLGCVCNVL